MSNRAAKITQADVRRVIRAAKREGAAEVEVRMGETAVIVRMKPSTGAESAPDQAGEIVL